LLARQGRRQNLEDRSTTPAFIGLLRSPPGTSVTVHAQAWDSCKKLKNMTLRQLENIRFPDLKCIYMQPLIVFGAGVSDFIKLRRT
jgi:hypothetical protein